MLAFSQYLELITEEKEDSGSMTSFRGKLNELAFVHAFNRYHELLNKHKDHEKAIQELSREQHLNPKNIEKDHPFKDTIQNIAKEIGHEEADRTLWDSHHSALATINHIHNISGGITGKPVWAGPDASGKTAEAASGYSSPADMLVNTKKGWHHISLKYSAEEKDKPTKLTQTNAKKLIDHVQKAHVENFGERDKNLDSEYENLMKGYGSSGLKDEKVARTLNAAGFAQDKNTGEFSKTALSKLGRYASNLQSGKDAKRHDKFRNELRNHFLKNGISEEEHDKHIKNLADVYDNVIKSGKTNAGARFMDAFHNATKRIYNEGKSGQHNLFKSIFNINPPGQGKVLVVKTKRSSAKGTELPKVSVADHARTLDDRLGKDSENQAYDSVKAGGTSTSTISTRDGEVLGRLSLDTGKSSPQIIGMSGGAIDRFDSIDHQHPSRTSTPVVPRPSAPQPKKPVIPTTTATNTGEFGQHRGSLPRHYQAYKDNTIGGHTDLSQ